MQLGTLIRRLKETRLGGATVRWAMLVAAVTITAWLVHHIGNLQPASTAYVEAPTTRAISSGAALFAANCSGCHGVSGRGDGPAARGLPDKPADLTAAHVGMHGDDELFRFISTGFRRDDDEATEIMPGFADVLSEIQRRDLVAFVRARNAGASFAAAGVWLAPVPAPDFPIICVAGKTSLSAFRGHEIRLVVGATVPASVATIVLMPNATGPDDACRAEAKDVAEAYAVLAGGAAGQEFLIDAHGWLRAFWSPPNPAALDRRLREVRTVPATDLGASIEPICTTEAGP